MIIKRRIVEKIADELKDFPLPLQRVYAARGVTQLSVLEKSLSKLLPFTDLLGIDKAALRLSQAVMKQERILIVGDFDADGATSSALAVSALRAMGAGEVDFLVPNRFEFGYGLSPGIVEVAKRWSPHLIITVDNGIASFDGVDTANAAGIDVLVTDHHLPQDTVPNACAIVNPNQKGCLFQSKAIAGVGVIFYVMLALRHALREAGWFTTSTRPAPNMAQFLDLVALGTVADVVPLDQNNRILVAQGLKRIRAKQCRPGIQALIEVAKRDIKYLQASDLGFAVGPRLNAAGRLDDMSYGINCLLASCHEQAKIHADKLDALNIERRAIEAQMQTQALEALERLATVSDDTALPKGLCLMDEAWHQGVIGILAGRLKERYHRPVIAFAKVSENELKGSARSVSGLNIRDVLAEIDVLHPGVIAKFGGHAMAAGLSLHPDNFEDFKAYFTQVVSKALGDRALAGEVLSDGALDYSWLNLDFAALLQEAGPFGQQFPEPVFDDDFEVLEQRLVGEKHLKLTVKHVQGGPAVSAIAFNIDTNIWPKFDVEKVHLAYTLDINIYRETKRLQLMVEHISYENE